MHILRVPSLWFLFVMCAVMSLFPGYSYYRQLSYAPGVVAYRELPEFFSNRPLAQYPVKTGDTSAPQLSAESIFIIDVESAVPIYEKDAHKSMYPASTTKLMTALVSRQLYDLDEIIEIPEATYSGSLMKLVPGERISYKNLLAGLLIPSGNDAAEVLAYHHPNGREGFVAQMNNTAQQLGLRGSHFVNPSGLPDSAHVSTAWDLGQLAAVAMHDEEIRSIVKLKEKTVYGVGGERHVLKTTNKLLGVIKGIDGVKTGYTDEAGEVLVSSVTRNNHQIIIVLLKSKDRFAETTSLINWVYANYEWRDIKPEKPLLNR